MMDAVMITLLLATRNAHKVNEMRSILSGNFCYRTLKDFPSAPEVVEDANSFAGNATKKSVELASWLSTFSNFQVDNGNNFILADDSGLEVDALQGAPGVYSARFANGGENSPDQANNEKLLRLLEDCPPEKRTARFRCVIALTPIVAAAPGSGSRVCLANEAELRTELFEGACEGRIIFAATGEGGFGYDPLFVPEGCSETFAELGETEKNRISHRAKALEKLRQRFCAGV